MNRARVRRTMYSVSGMVVTSPILSWTVATARSRRVGSRSASAARRRTWHSLAGEVGACSSRAGRLRVPVVRERFCVKGIEPGVLDQRHGRLAVLLAVGGSGDGDVARAPAGLPSTANEWEPIAFHTLAIGRPRCSVTHRLSS